MNIPQPENANCPDPRVSTKVQVYFGTENQLSLATFISASADVSSGGLYLLTERPMDIGEQLLLRFRLFEGNKPITCKARVAWRNDRKQPCKPRLSPGVGVEFIDLSVKDRCALERFIKGASDQP